MDIIYFILGIGVVLWNGGWWTIGVIVLIALGLYGEYGPKYPVDKRKNL